MYPPAFVTVLGLVSTHRTAGPCAIHEAGDCTAQQKYQGRDLLWCMSHAVMPDGTPSTAGHSVC